MTFNRNEPILELLQSRMYEEPARFKNEKFKTEVVEMLLESWKVKSDEDIQAYFKVKR